MHAHTHTSKETISTEQCRAHHIIDKGQKERAGKKRAEHRERLTEKRTHGDDSNGQSQASATLSPELSRSTSKGVHVNKCWEDLEESSKNIHSCREAHSGQCKGQQHNCTLPEIQNFLCLQMN